MAAFPIVQISTSSNPEMWGPPTTTTKNISSEPLDNVPFSFYSKSDRLGKITDWIFQDPKFGTNYRNWNSRYFYSGNQSNEFTYVHQEDTDDSFKMVESLKQTKGSSASVSKYDSSNTSGFSSAGGNRRNQNYQQKGRGNQRSAPYQSRRFNKDPSAEHKRNKDLGVNIQPDWELIQTIEFSSLTKLSTTQVSEPTDLITCGKVEYYDTAYDNVTAQKSRPLETINRNPPPHITASDDPIIRQYSMDGTGNVFATDDVLTLLMSCSRSILPWDIIVQRVGSKLFLDRREGSYFDLVTVNETCSDLPHEDKDSINNISELMREATHINNVFSQQVLSRGKKKKQFDKPSPFPHEGEQPSVAYKYRQWTIGDQIKLVARCEFDAVRTKNGKEETILIKALNEYDPKMFGMEWRQKLDTQRGGVLMTELKNNSLKLARWAAQSLLVGADNLLLGFVSRLEPHLNNSHVVLGAHFHKPQEFINTVHVSTNNMWGTLRGLIETLHNLPEGKYILLKDTTQAAALLYQIPADTEFTVGPQE